MALSAHVGSFNIDTSKTVGQTQAITGVGFQPKLVLFWWSGSTATGDAVGGGTYNIGFGAAISSSSRFCIDCISEDNDANGDTYRRSETDQIVACFTAVGVLDGLLDLSSMDADGFTVVVDDQFTQAYRVSYLALGGDDLANVFIGNKQTPAVTGNYDITGVGFQPDAVLLCGVGLNAAQTAGDHTFFSLGIADDAGQGVVSMWARDAVAAADTYGYGYGGECHALIGLNRDSFVAFGADGFTLNHLETSGGQLYFYFVALQGGSYAAGNLLTRTDGNDIAEDVGFQPSAVLFASACRALSTQDTATDNAAISIGAATSASNRAAAAVWDQDGADPTETALANSDSAVYLNIASDDAIQGAMDLKSIDAGGFTCVMDDPDPSACWVTYLAFGDAPGSPSSSPSSSPSASPSATPSASPSEGTPSGSPSASPSEGTPSASPSEGTPSGSPSSSPSEGTPSASPSEGTPSSSPSEGTPSASPSEETPSGSPSEGTPSASPSEGTPSSSPSEGTPSESPSEGTPSGSPSGGTPSGSPSASPSEGTPSASPSEGTPSASPSEGTPSGGPSSSPSGAPEGNEMRISFKNHNCEQIGTLSSWDELTAVSHENDVGDARLVAHWGASDEDDAILDRLTVADLIVEVWIRPYGQRRFLETPAWTGFLRDARIEQDGPVKKGTWLFKDFNHLLARRLIKPAGGESHDEDYGTTANIMRGIVRRHCADLAEEARRFPGLSVEADDNVDTTIYGETSSMVFGSNLPAFVRVNCLAVWNGWLYAGCENAYTSGGAAIYRTNDGTTWVQVYDGSPGLYAENTHAILCFKEWGGELWAGAATRNGVSGDGVLLRTDDGALWRPSHTFVDRYAVWSLAEFDGYLYAGLTAYTNSALETIPFLTRSADGTTWEDVLTVTGRSYLIPALKTNMYHVVARSIQEWNGELYVGLGYKFISCMALWGVTRCEDMVWRAIVMKTADGTTFDSPVFDGTWGVGYSGTGHFEVDTIGDVLCFEEWGDHLYAGLGSNRHTGLVEMCRNPYRAGVWRTEDGSQWEQVFSGTEETISAVSDMMVTFGADGTEEIWAATGTMITANQAKVYRSSDGETWHLCSNLLAPPYPFVLSLADFVDYHYAGTGSYNRTPVCNSPATYSFTADYGDIWRIVPASSDDAETGMSSRWTSVLEKLQEIAEESGRHDFRIEGRNSFLYCEGESQEFLFSVRSPQWGADRRWNGEHGTSLAIQRGNLLEPQYDTVRGTRPTHLYLLGPSADSERLVEEYANTSAQAESPWNRIEAAVDAQGMDSPASRASTGWAELELLGPERTLSFQVQESADFYYPRHIGFGDWVTASYAGILADCKIIEVVIHASNPVYQVGMTFDVESIVEPEDVEVLAGGYAYDNPRMWRSVDSGGAFNVAHEGMAGNAGIWDVCACGDSILAAVSHNSGGLNQGKVWRSTDRGVTWQQVFSVPVASERWALSLVATGTGAAILGTGPTGNLYRSEDGGDTWTLEATIGAASYVYALRVTASGNVLAFVGNPASGTKPRVWRSTDDGLTWALLKQMDASSAYGFQEAFITDRGTILAGTNQQGEVWRSTDEESWTKVLAMSAVGGWTMGGVNAFCQTGDAILMGADAYLAISTDDGLTWEIATTFAHSVLSLLTLPNGNALAGMDSGVAGNAPIYRSTDGGETWTPHASLPSNDYAVASLSLT